MKTRILSLAILPVACSGGEEENGGGGASSNTGGVREFTIIGNDQMKYDTSMIEVKAGEKVKITLKNGGKMPKAAMGHNLVILKKGSDVTAIGSAAAATANADNDWYPEEVSKLKADAEEILREMASIEAEVTANSTIREALSNA